MANVFFFVVMDAFVNGKVAPITEAFPTFVTGVGLLSGVSSDVNDQIMLGMEHFLAIRAGDGSHVLVNSDFMSVEGKSSFKRGRT